MDSAYLNYVAILRVCCAMIVGCAVSQQAPAITFDLNFVTGAANPNDPGDVGLQAIVQEAADRWADIIEDAHTMKLNVSYFVNGASGNGPCGPNVRTACAPIVSANRDGTRTVEGDLLFFADRDWYLDPTPGNDSEFDLTQTLYQDLSPAQQLAGYSGETLEPLLEVGFRGGNNGSDPNVAGNVDMLSTALHEIGHHLGVTNQLSAARGETADDDYDLPSSLIGGRTMAVEAAPGLEFHFVDFFPMMSNRGSPLGSRRLPTAADVFAAAAVSGWNEIDLPRQDFLKGTSWGTAGNWMGNQTPGSADDAFLRGAYNDLNGSGDVVLDQNGAVANLFVGTASNLRTGPHRLDVTGTTTIELGGISPFSQISVEPNGELATGNLHIDGGALAMKGGRAEIQSTLTITKDASGGHLTGYGVVEVQSSLINHGLIEAADDATLQFISSSAGPVFDLDGSGSGEVRAVAGDLIVSGKLVTEFSGQMTIGGGRFVEINDDWRLGAGGHINLQGGAAAESSAELRGGSVEILGHVETETAGAHFFNAPSQFLAGSSTNVQTGTELIFNAPVTWSGGHHLGGGSMSVNNAAAVQSGTIDFAELQIGGSATMTVDGGDIFAANFVKESGGTLTLSSGTLTVDGGAGLFNSSLAYSGPALAEQPTFNVERGGDVSVTLAWSVGEAAGEFGAVNVRSVQGGNRSTLRGTGGGESADLVVGHFGAGTLLVADGGLVDFGDDFIIGSEEGSTGEATLSGVNDGNRSEVLITRAGNNATLNVGRLGAGQLRVEDGARLAVGGNGTVGSGAAGVGIVEIGGSTGGLDASLEIGDHFAVGGGVSGNGGLGTVAVNAGGALSANQITVWNEGRIEVVDGKVVADGNVVVDGGVLNVASGSGALALSSGATLTNRNGGVVTGGGSIAMGGSELLNQAVVAPGVATGTLRITDGAYRQDAAGTLRIELAGTLPEDTDSLLVGGSAVIGGTLEVRLFDSFEPSAGDAFRIIDASGGVAGRFNTAIFPALDNLTFQVDYDDNAVTLTVASISPGDFNADGRVDSGDYLQWQQGRSPNPLSVADLNDWEANYGADAAAARAVPEPSAALLVFCFVFLSGYISAFRRSHHTPCDGRSSCGARRLRAQLACRGSASLALRPIVPFRS